MTTRGFSPVPVDLGSASTETEENRAFFQDRLCLYTGWLFVLAFGFYLLSAANALAVPYNFLAEPTTTFQGLGCATVGVVWIMMRMRAWPWTHLLVIDAVTIVSTCLRCLEKAPDDRFSTARDLTRALSECAISTPWSLDRANELWTGSYTAHVDRGRQTPADSLPTLAVDIGDRINSVGSP